MMVVVGIAAAAVSVVVVAAVVVEFSFLNDCCGSLLPGNHCMFRFKCCSRGSHPVFFLLHQLFWRGERHAHSSHDVV
eukprot:7398127-Pyramimonas_sp.AAC.1